MPVIGDNVGHVEIQHMGPAIIAPKNIQDLVKKSNEAISEHRDWLAGFPRHDDFASSNPSTRTVTVTMTASHLPSARITTPPLLELRAPVAQGLAQCPSAFCDVQINSAVSMMSSMCNSTVASVQASASTELANQLAVFTASVPGVNVALGGVPAAQSSASVALAQAASESAAASVNVSSANALASSAILALATVNSSLNLVVASASSAAVSLSSEVSLAQQREQAASTQAAIAQSSAAQILSIANSIAADAKATATAALAEALSTISAINGQATVAIQEARIEAMSATKFALVVTFSIIGSSLVTILGFYLIMRYRNKRKASMVQYYPDYYANPKTQRSPGSENPFDDQNAMGEKGGAFSARDDEWDFARGEEKRGTIAGVEAIEKRNSRRSSKKSKASSILSRSSSGTKPSLSRKNTLVYDLDKPDQPPRFRSWLTESFKGWDRTSRDIKADAKKKRKEEGDEIRKMAIQKIRDAEERREVEKRRREDEEAREKRRLENEEVEKRLGLRREESDDAEGVVVPVMALGSDVGMDDGEGSGVGGSVVGPNGKKIKSEYETESEVEDSDDDVSDIGTAR